MEKKKKKPRSWFSMEWSGRREPFSSLSYVSLKAPWRPQLSPRGCQWRHSGEFIRAYDFIFSLIVLARKSLSNTFFSLFCGTEWRAAWAPSIILYSTFELLLFFFSCTPLERVYILWQTQTRKGVLSIIHRLEKCGVQIIACRATAAPRRPITDKLFKFSF